MSKIKSISLYKYDYILKDINSDEFELKGGIYNKTSYDQEGRILSEIKYDASGGIEQHYEYEYNEKGNKTADRSYDENGELIDNMEYEIDENGKRLFAYKIYLDGSKDTITYRYDAEERLVSKEVKDDEDELERTEVFAYEGTNEVLHESRDEENRLVYRKETRYTEKAEVLEEKTWSEETDSTSRLLNEYNNDGQLTSVTSFAESGDIVFKVSYEHDEKQQIVKVIEKSIEGENHTIIEYDEHGNAIVQEDRNADGILNTRIERVYDENGNIIESEAIVDQHGKARNQHYVLKYEYAFF